MKSLRLYLQSFLDLNFYLLFKFFGEMFLNFYTLAIFEPAKLRCETVLHYICNYYFNLDVLAATFSVTLLHNPLLPLDLLY